MAQSLRLEIFIGIYLLDRQVNVYASDVALYCSPEIIDIGSPSVLIDIDYVYLHAGQRKYEPRFEAEWLYMLLAAN